MRVMITGSRDWTDSSLIQASLVTINATMRKDNEPTTLVHGGANGADTIGAAAATELGWALEEHIPDWSKGKRAGPLRNVEMLESGIDLVIAFHKDNSRGTKHAIETARKMKIPVKVHT